MSNDLRPSIEWEQTWSDGAAVARRFGRVGDLVVAEWSGVGRLYAARDGSTTRFEPDDAASDADAERIRGVVAPALVRHLRGEIALHASAVVVGACAVAFVGKSGAGKSTLAAAFCELSGAALAADDMTFVSYVDAVPTVTPTETSIRLLEPGQPRRPKRAVAPPRVAQAAAPLRAIVELSVGAPETSPRVEALHGARRFRAVSESLFRFLSDDEAINLRDFESIAALARDVEIVELRRPWEDRAIARSAAVVDGWIRAARLA